MEHRWGRRVGVDMPVRVSRAPLPERPGRIRDLSISGAFIHTDCDFTLLSRIQVAIDPPHRAGRAVRLLSACVVRRSDDGVGIEWCVDSPPATKRGG